tara:strand:+ start:682 stop:846 length:165 start_codon:yes stop_codon:yes gene_type:complete
MGSTKKCTSAVSREYFKKPFSMHVNLQKIKQKLKLQSKKSHNQSSKKSPTYVGL